MYYRSASSSLHQTKSIPYLRSCLLSIDQNLLCALSLCFVLCILFRCFANTHNHECTLADVFREERTWLTRISVHTCQSPTASTVTVRPTFPPRAQCANLADRSLILHRINEEVIVRLKWGQTEYKGILVSVDSYMNIQLNNTEEYIDRKQTGTLGQVLIRCNNVLWVSAAKGVEMNGTVGDVKMED